MITDIITFSQNYTCCTGPIILWWLKLNSFAEKSKTMGYPRFSLATSTILINYYCKKILYFIFSNSQFSTRDTVHTTSGPVPPIDNIHRVCVHSKKENKVLKILKQILCPFLHIDLQ